MCFWTRCLINCCAEKLWLDFVLSLKVMTKFTVTVRTVGLESLQCPTKRVKSCNFQYWSVLILVSCFLAWRRRCINRFTYLFCYLQCDVVRFQMSCCGVEGPSDWKRSTWFTNPDYVSVACCCDILSSSIVVIIIVMLSLRHLTVYVKQPMNSSSLK